MNVELDKDFAVGLVRYLANRPYAEVFMAVPVLTEAIEAAGGDDPLLEDDEAEETPETS